MPLPVRAAAAGLGAVAVLLSGGCGGFGPPPPATSEPSSGAAEPGPASPATPASQPAATVLPDASQRETVSSPSGTPAVEPASTCVDRVLGRLSQQERIGQLLMVAVLASRGAASFDPSVYHVGGVFYLGGWRGAPAVSAASSALQAQATDGVGLLVAADQEGGQVQQLRGSGFSDLPTAIQQGKLSRPQLTDLWTRAGEELAAAGVNVDLAPVADVVAPGAEPANAPIGKYARHYGSSPAEVGDAVTAVVTGLTRSNVAATVKHFPGLGRVGGNTDVTAKDITDEETGPDDANLEPFRAGIAAGAGLVMVSSARYPRLDPENPALFSPAVITGLLRTQLGYAGVVVSDDVGVAAAVAGVPVGERATRFLAAGGDIVVTADAAQAPAMVSAVAQRARQDPAFAGQLQASARRVLVLKQRMGLLRCG